MDDSALLRLLRSLGDPRDRFREEAIRQAQSLSDSDHVRLLALALEPPTQSEKRLAWQGGAVLAFLAAMLLISVVAVFQRSPFFFIPLAVAVNAMFRGQGAIGTLLAKKPYTIDTLVETLSETATDGRYAEFLLHALASGRLSARGVECAEARLRDCLDAMPESAARRVPQHISRALLGRFRDPYADVEWTLQIIRALPKLRCEEALPWLTLLSQEPKATLNMQRVSFAAQEALRELREELEEQTEEQVLLRPSEERDTSLEMLLRPSKEVDDMPDKLLRPTDRE